MTDREKEEDLRHDNAREDEREAPDVEALERLLAQPFALGDALRKNAADELQRRDGEWSAFSAHVFKKIDDAQLEATRMSLEERAVAAMKNEVDTELAELAPRFEASFKQGIEERIWREAKARPSFGAMIESWKESLRELWFGRVRTIGYAAAAAAAVIVAIAVSGVPQLDGGGDRGLTTTSSSESAVSVERVSFEGTATVMQTGDITVVWLADESAS